MPIIGGFLAIGLGIAALIQIRRHRGRRTGASLAVVGIAIGALTTIGWGLLLTNDEFWEGVREGIEEAQQESATSTVLSVGDCLDIPIGESDLVTIPADAPVPCTTLHTAEYIGSAVLPDSAEYPGEDEVFYQGLDRCLDLFVDYTGAELATYPDLNVLVEYPRSLNWRLADREVSCYVFNIDGTATTGSILD